MRRITQKPDPKSFDLTHECPACQYKIPPNEIVHIDGTRIRCPQCEAETGYQSKPAQMTS